MKTTHRTTSLALAAAAMIGLAGCTNTPLYGNAGSTPVNNYPGSSSSQAYAQWGQVTNVELVRGGQSGGTLGTIAGGVVGGLAGNQVGGGTGRTVATVVGAVGGALVGRAIEQNTQQPTQDHYRVTVRLDDGSARTFNYPEAPNVRQGDRVRIEGDQLYR